MTESATEELLQLLLFLIFKIYRDHFRFCVVLRYENENDVFKLS